MNSCATVNGAGLEQSGATTAGSVDLAAQQLFWIDALDSEAEAQQSCPAFGACRRQIPDGAIKVPINKMAIAAR